MRDLIELIFGVVIIICIIYALAYGVTYDGVHYSISLGEERGLEIKKEKAK